MKKRNEDTDFLQKMQEGITAILSDDKATISDRIDAITAGTKIMMVKHKIKDDGGKENGGGKFFGKGR